MDFSEEQMDRYSRHLILPGIGARGQEKLLRARVVIIGAGGLGCAVGYYLAAAGVGTIGLVDNDTVETSNLQRQIAHSMKTVGMSKVDSAKATFEALNPDVAIVGIKERVRRDNIENLLGDYDIVVDGSDNFQTRYLVNDACVLMKKPLISGAILGFEGQVTTIMPGEGHCYRCLFEEVPPEGLVPSCSQAGVIGAITGVIGSLQAVEVIKLIVGKGKVLKNSLLTYDALTTTFRRLTIPANPDCPVCNKHSYIKELGLYDTQYCRA
ncbi:MAG: HesA/MoeB/ThiF family protein [Dissulfurispiraceae bacterium]